jgi:GrpB-like predicted nucleotidyltransferase (UPF0157 family)
MTEEPIRLVPYDTKWPETFAREKSVLGQTIGEYIVGDIHHIGSTAVPGLSAKPIIDILVGVENLESSRSAIPLLEKTQYCYYPYKPQFMHWFCKPSPEHRTHHLHLVPVNSPEYKAKLVFRDILRSETVKRKKYADLKKSLAQQYQNDREAYTKAKTAFIRQTVRDVLGAQFQFEED